VLILAAQNTANNVAGLLIGPVLMAVGVVAIKFRDRIHWPGDDGESPVYGFTVRFFNPAMLIMFGILIFWSALAGLLH
jgi:hypothetical protein